MLVVVLRMTALDVAETGAGLLLLLLLGPSRKTSQGPYLHSPRRPSNSTAPKGLYSSILLDSFLAIENPLDRMAKLYGNLVMG